MSACTDAKEELVKLKLADLVVDEAIQSRVSIDHATVEKYCDECRDGAKFPPMHAVKDADGTFWLWRGFHRRDMYALLKTLRVDVMVRSGTKLDAIRLSAGDNADHGLPRTRGDKERAVLMLIAQEEWRNSTTKWLADTAKVSWSFVESVRKAHGGIPDKVKNTKGHERTGTNTPRQTKPISARESAAIDTGQLEQLGDATPPVPLPAGVVEDGFHRPVPETLNAVFADRRELLGIATDIARLRNRFNVVVRHASKAGAMISIAAVDKALDEANAAIRGGAPKCMCPECDAIPSSEDAEPCHHCEGRGWLPEARYATLPKRLREKAESHLRSDA